MLSYRKLYGPTKKVNPKLDMYCNKFYKIQPKYKQSLCIENLRIFLIMVFKFLTWYRDCHLKHIISFADHDTPTICCAESG